MDAINTIAEKYNLPVIEDAAQSFGATYKGKNPAIFQPSVVHPSFRPNLSVVMETAEPSLPMMMSWLKSSVGYEFMDRNRKHHHPILGINGRMDTLQAAILLEILDVFPDEVIKRQQLGQIFC